MQSDMENQTVKSMERRAKNEPGRNSFNPHYYQSLVEVSSANVSPAMWDTLFPFEWNAQAKTTTEHIQQ